jgi:uncharacterized peroxidase-related enzyme
MSFLKTIEQEGAAPEVAVIYDRDIERMGYLPNYTRTFSLHPGAYEAWRHLIAAIAKPMGERRYELATIGAATRLRSSYCSLAHGKILNDKYFDSSELRRVVETPSDSPLDGVETLIVEFAAKVAGDATTVIEDDIERLRAAGLGDREILDVILAAAARSFYSKVLDATGTLADAVYRELDPELRDVLTVGRPIQDS